MKVVIKQTFDRDQILGLVMSKLIPAAPVQFGNSDLMRKGRFNGIVLSGMLSEKNLMFRFEVSRTEIADLLITEMRQAADYDTGYARVAFVGTDSGLNYATVTLRN